MTGTVQFQDAAASPKRRRKSRHPDGNFITGWDFWLSLGSGSGFRVLIVGPRYREWQRKRQEAAGGKRGGRPRNKAERADEPGTLPELVDRGPLQLTGLLRGLLSLAPQLDKSRAAPLTLDELREPAAKVLAYLSAHPACPGCRRCSHGAPIHDAGLSADGALLLTAGGDGVVRIYDGHSGRRLTDCASPRAGRRNWPFSPMAPRSHR